MFESSLEAYTLAKISQKSENQKVKTKTNISKWIVWKKRWKNIKAKYK